jgi:hypothetical protein
MAKATSNNGNGKTFRVVPQPTRGPVTSATVRELSADGKLSGIAALARKYARA